jgi:TonB family protein
MDAGRTDEASGTTIEEMTQRNQMLVMKFFFPLIATFGLLIITAMLAFSGVVQQPVQESGGRECTVPAHNGKDLDQKPRILAKPEPKFSVEERRRFEGEVITLGALLCASGEVTDIKVKDGLSRELDEKAIEAARKIQFTPGEKDGSKVSRFIVLKYIVR